MKMKRNYIYYLLALLLTTGIISCEKDDRDSNLTENVAIPSNLDVIVQLTTDNTGLATFTPSGESVSVFIFDFGDGSAIEEVLPGNTIQHMYQEGSYNVIVTGQNINGDTASITQDVVIAFAAPENLQVSISPVSGDAFSIAVSATADNAVGFEVFFGDVLNEVATPLMLNETVTHTYAEVGMYDVTVVALSGGIAAIEETTTVTIENPIILPIDFESTTQEYTFTDFGGAITTLASNPDMSGENTSNNVAQFVKENGAEIFAGTIIELGAPIDFSQFEGFSLSSWSPIVGATVKLKLENGTDPNISAEIDATTTVANQWETLNYDFSTTDLTQEYSKIIVFFDFGNTGAGDTFYFDNIIQSTGTNGNEGPEVTLPVDFENTEIDYMILGFEGAESTVEANPDPTGINPSATVVRTQKTNGAQFFAGTIVPLDVPIDFSTSEIVKIKTWSPKAGIPVRLKLESPDGTQFVELDVNTSVTNQWEELSWDFTGMTTNNLYTKAVIFFEFIVDLPGDDSTYYFDDIQLAN